jgi:hypothetical protein
MDEFCKDFELTDITVEELIEFTLTKLLRLQNPNFPFEGVPIKQVFKDPNSNKRFTAVSARKEKKTTAHETEKRKKKLIFLCFSFFFLSRFWQNFFEKRELLPKNLEELWFDNPKKRMSYDSQLLVSSYFLKLIDYFERMRKVLFGKLFKKFVESKEIVQVLKNARMIRRKKSHLSGVYSFLFFSFFFFSNQQANFAAFEFCWSSKFHNFTSQWLDICPTKDIPFSFARFFPSTKTRFVMEVAMAV